MSKFFKVIKEDEIECCTCRSKVPGYIIVFHDGKEECGTGRTFGSKSDAQEVCQDLNWAYQLGKSAKSTVQEGKDNG